MITETYREVEIVLLEDENKWRFTANGRERTAPTLPKAREYINNALDAVEKKKEKKWEPFEAWYQGRFGGREFIKVTVTSEAGAGYSSEREFWISYQSKDYRGRDERKREKVRQTELFVDSPESAELIQRSGDLKKQAAELEDDARQLIGKLVPINPSTTEELETVTR